MTVETHSRRCTVQKARAMSQRDGGRRGSLSRVIDDSSASLIRRLMDLAEGLRSGPDYGGFGLRVMLVEDKV